MQQIIYHNKFVHKDNAKLKKIRKEKNGKINKEPKKCHYFHINRFYFISAK